MHTGLHPSNHREAVGPLMAKNPKFDWIDAVAADQRLTASERLVLITSVLKDVLSTGDTFCVRQETIAERTGTGIATVKRAIAHAREFGYLVTIERQRGRGHRRGDAHRIIPNPGIATTEIGITADTSSGQQIGINGTEIGIKNDTNRDQKPPEIGIKNAPKPTSDQPLPAPQGSLKGSSTDKRVFDKPHGYGHGPPRRTGVEIARTRFEAIPAETSPTARELIDVYDASLAAPMEAKFRREITAEIDSCLRAGQTPAAITSGLKAWTDSGSWSPTQIPKFVHKAANSHANGHVLTGPDQKAAGWLALGLQTPTPSIRKELP